MLTIPNEIIALCKADSTRKNFRVTFPNGEYTDLTNDDIVAGSVQFTESISSKDVLQFGLAESSRIEFECVNVPNIYGVVIQCGIEIDTSSLTPAEITSIQGNEGDGVLVLEINSDIGFGYYRIPYGTFTVTSCPRSAGAMWKRKVEAYSNDISNSGISKLLQTKLDANTTDTIAQNPLLMVAQEVNDLSWLNVTEQTETEDYSTTWNQIQAGTHYGYTGWADGADNYVVYLTFGKAQGIYPQSSNDVMYRFTCDYDSTFYDALVTQLLTYNASDYAINKMRNRCMPSVSYVGLNLGALSTLGMAFDDPEDSGFIYPTRNSNTTNRVYIVYFTNLLISIEKNGTEVYSTSMSNPVTNAVFKSYTLNNSTDAGMKITLNGEQAGTNVYTYANSLDVSALIKGTFELNGQFLKSSRNGNNTPVMLSKSSPVSVNTDEYSSMWWDEYDVSPIGTINITYQDIDLGTEPTIIYDIESGLSVYDMTDNYLLKHLGISVNDLNGQTVEQYVINLIDTYFIPNIQDVGFTPVNLEMLGLPYLESGDYLEIDDGNGGTVGTYIMNHSISGEQFLFDDIESKGGEIINATERSA